MNDHSRSVPATVSAQPALLKSLIAIVIFFACASCSHENESADTILYNGKIITVDSSFSIREAVAIREGRILDTGTKDAMMRLAGDNTRLIDLEGHAVTPGLIDFHVHPVSASQSELFDSIPDVKNIQQLLDWIKKQSQLKADGEWIIHPKFFITRMEDMRQITLRELDEAAPANPVFLNGSFGGVINSQALRLSKMSNLSHPGILKDEKTGRPNGLIRSSAFKLLAIPKRDTVTATQKAEALKGLFAEYNRIGITSACSGGGPMSEFNAFEELRQKSELTVRIFHNLYVPFGVKKTEEEVSDELRKIGLKTGDGNEWVRMGALKVVMDGGMLTGTAFLHEGWGARAKDLYGITDPNYRGELMYSKKEMITLITAAAKYGWKFTAHVTGGGGVDTLLAAYEAVNAVLPIHDKRFSVIHGNFFTPDAVGKMAALGIYADMQPAWFFKDTDLLHHILGSNRIKNFHPYHSLIEAGVRINGGSDHMVKADPDRSINPYNPFTAMWSAVTRKTDKGTVFNPEQAISREEALKMYTINNAYASFEEDVKGSIEKGKFADLIVLSDDLLTCEKDSIRNIKPLLTIVDGKVVYNSNVLRTGR